MGDVDGVADQALAAIEAGYEAGGEMVGQMSAGLIVASERFARPLLDIRIDLANPGPADGGDAVVDLRRTFDALGPLADYYAEDWLAARAAGYMGAAVASRRAECDRRAGGRPHR